MSASSAATRLLDGRLQLDAIDSTDAFFDLEFAHDSHLRL
jgi:hypothetical protein